MEYRSEGTKNFYLIRYSDDETDLPLFDECGQREGPHVSIVIGPNGCGKSRYLARVADELIFLEQYRNASDGGRALVPPTSSATLRYRMDGRLCEISRKARDIVCRVEGVQRAIEDVPFPRRVAVVAHLPADRFRFSDNRDDGRFYRYLGLRQSTNLTTTGALESKVVESLMRGFQHEQFESRMTRWLALAGFSGEVRVELVIRDPGLLSGDERVFGVAAERMQRSRVGSARSAAFRETPNWASELALMRSFFASIRDAAWTKGGRRLVATIDLVDFVQSQEDVDRWQAGFQAARRWRALDGASLILSKGKQRFRFSDLSSGEQQIIGTNARLLAEISPYALVIIDEPEVSLHPAWQMRYVPTLEEVLEAFGAVHAVIATHSHFMVSDVESQKSSLVVAGVGERAKFSFFEGEVLGRSPENVLYRVFGVAATGNASVEKDLHDALAMLSDAMPYKSSQLREIHGRLSRICGADNVVLKEIVDEIGSALEVRQ